MRQSWRNVEPIADAAAIPFHDRLFETDPTARPLSVGSNLPKQRRRLMVVAALP